MRCSTGAIYCPFGINPSAVELICKGRDRQYGVYSMLAVVISTYHCLLNNHHTLCDQCVHTDPSSEYHPLGC